MNSLSIARGIGFPAIALMCSTALAGGFSAASITLAPGLEDSVRSKYGAQEVPSLRSQIDDSVEAALKGAHDRCTLDIDVVLQRVAPSHPTLQQQRSNPSLDPFLTRFAQGGAALVGHLRDADGRERATVNFESFADDPRSASVGKDPWSDARMAIDRFAAKLVSTCEKQEKASAPG